MKFREHHLHPTVYTNELHFTIRRAWLALAEAVMFCLLHCINDATLLCVTAGRHVTSSQLHLQHTRRGGGGGHLSLKMPFVYIC